jgi:hypothetical protein
LARCVETVQERHSNVEDDDIGLQLQSLFHGLAAVAGFTANFPALVFFQESAQSAPNNFVIVGQQDS